jgi:aldose sugar dehydrogenase
MYRKIFIAAFLAITTLPCVAQTEKEQVNAIIEIYFDGWATSDTVKVSKAMHSSCHLKYFRDGKFVDVNKNAYLGNFGSPKPRNAAIKTSILSTDITGNIAQAKTKIETDKAIYIDYFNLIKIN